MRYYQAKKEIAKRNKSHKITEEKEGKND